ncbi:AAA family ATPase [Candidatus Bathyarchaeota archaeon]|nr:AAA family ATPase [Candidatus Bathyarchaeota archaeon]
MWLVLQHRPHYLRTRTKTYKHIRRGAATDFDLEHYKPMPVRYELRYMMLKHIREGKDPLPDIQGREETKNDVIRAVLSGSYPYLVSREGTGKTRLAESLAKLLPPVPRVKGCSYNCDPKWPREWKCPVCQDEDDPEIEFISGSERYSRIQGNEYTNEAKILGVKDIQAIIGGDSPTDPSAFIGTGVLRGNRGVVCVDELPAIPTKVQVLFHPMLQENRIVLEEYNWVRPIDIFFVATGNPTGFSHVNRVPEPLLDRLELIHMGLPNESVEREIMFKEGFRVVDDFFTAPKRQADAAMLDINAASIKRQSFAPWWIVEVVEKTVRYTRECPNIERGSSIRGSIKSLDHAYSSTELRKASVCSLQDASEGLKLALRGRIRIRADLIGFDESPSAYMMKNNEVVEDVLWYAARDVGKSIITGLGDEIDAEMLAKEIGGYLSRKSELSEYVNLKTVIDYMRGLQPWSKPVLVNDMETLIRDHPEAVDPSVYTDYVSGAVGLISHMLLAENIIDELPGSDLVYLPSRMK